MNTVRKPFHAFALATLLAAMGTSAFAQTAAPAAPATATAPAAKEHGGPRDHAGRGDPAKMQAHFAKRQADLKAKLKLTAAQEPSWNAFTSAMQPPANWKRPDRAEFAKLTTPERIDKMKALRAERNARMDQRADATKTFYTALTAEQKKTFDESTLKRGHGKHGGGLHKG
jgi:protein CpxP